MKPRFSLAAMMACVTALAVAFWVSVTWPVIYTSAFSGTYYLREPVTREIAWRLVFLGPLALVAARITLGITRKLKR
jgi:hypothetical protein